MASSSGMFLFYAGLRPRGWYASGCRRIAGDAYASRIVDGVEDRGSSRNHSLLADSLGAERPNRRRVFDENRLNRRHVPSGGNQVVVKVLAFPGEEFLHERHPQTLRGAAFDLSLDEGRIDGTPDVGTGGDLQHADCAQFCIEGDLRHMRAKSEDGIGGALTVFVE